jgi:hypothetical protein
MKYLQDIRACHQDPRRLEDLYQSARRENETSAFTSALLACHDASPDNLLYAAWYYRLQQTQAEQAEGRSVNWKLAVPLSLVMGLIFWLLSDPALEFDNGMPYFMLTWAPISACFTIAFLSVTARQHLNRSLLLATGLVSAGIYVSLFTMPSGHVHYRDLMAFHLPLLAWIGVGLSILCLLIYKQFKDGPAAWIRSLQSTFSTGAIGYVVWTIFLILALPWLF